MRTSYCCIWPIRYFFLLIAFCSCIHANAQPGSVDTTFNPSDKGFPNGANNVVWSSALQPDGKIVVAGDFTSFRGLPVKYIMRLNPDGTLDPTFDVTQGPNAGIISVLRQPDGKLLIAGIFIQVAGSARNCIARLNSDGTLDGTFLVGTGLTHATNPAWLAAYTLSMQADGKILVGGDFTHYNGVARNRICRLNTDGSIDLSFNPGTGASGRVFNIHVLSSGKLLVTGEFTQYNSVSRLRIAMLNSNGTLDNTYAPGGASGSVRTSVMQADGKLVVAGGFTSINGQSVMFVARLNVDGSFDYSFNTGTGFYNVVYSSAIQPDGKIVFGGTFQSFNGVSTRGIVRLNQDGTRDATFSVGSGFYSASSTSGDPLILNIMLLPGNSFFIGGTFSKYASMSRNNFAKLQSNGSLDETFDLANGPSSAVNCITRQADGKILIGGLFNYYNKVQKVGAARISYDGSLDATFNPQFNSFGSVEAVLVQPDNRILFAGNFGGYGGSTNKNLARSNSNGTPDAGFSVGSGPNATVKSLELQADGKILAAGLFTTFNGASRKNIVRLNSNGSVDGSFNPAGPTDPTYVSVDCIKYLPDGKILVGGYFSYFNSLPRANLVRLNTDGSVDLTFTSGATGQVKTIYRYPDGKLLIAGDFDTYSGQPRDRIARVDANGVLDPTFNPGLAFNGLVYTVDVQADGKIIVSGNFTNYNGIARKFVARLLSNGQLDATFNPGTGPDYLLNTSALMPDGTILIGGSFTKVNGIGRSNLALLVGNITYQFTGTGDWNNPANWVNGLVPPVPVPRYAQVTITPSAGGNCVFTGTFYISKDAVLNVPNSAPSL